MSLKAASALPPAGAFWPNAPVTAKAIANMQAAEISSILEVILYIFTFLSWVSVFPILPKCFERVRPSLSTLGRLGQVSRNREIRLRPRRGRLAVAEILPDCS